MFTIRDGSTVGLSFRSTVLDILISLSASASITLVGKWTGDYISGSVAGGLSFVLFMLLRLERKLDAVCATVHRIDNNTRDANEKPNSQGSAQPQVPPARGAEQA